MKFYDAKVLRDAKDSEERRFRNILANSGQIMESGEIRDLDNLYVMSRDGKLIAIKALDKNPDKQTEDYTVKAQADHGQIVEGELVDTIEKQFGSCKVWLDSDGLHARMYFANDDALADHAYAISEDASYSTGIDWYPDGYYGVGQEIEEPIGILREISMVLVGNDPRAKTIDHKEAEAPRTNGSEGEDAEDGDNINNEGEEMPKSKDELTPEENEAMKNRLAGELVDRVVEVVDDFTTKAPESETEPTAVDTKDEGEVTEEKTADAEEAPAETEAPAEPEKEESKDTVVHNINIYTRDRVVKNEQPTITKDAKAELKNLRANALRDALQAANFKFDTKFETAFADKTKDAVTGLGDPVNIANVFTEAMEQADGILSYIEHIPGRGIRNNVLSSEAEAGLGAQGHKKGDTKVDQSIANTIRVAYDKMIYKKLTLDAMEIYENPELIDFRARELIDQIYASIERAIFIGDGRTAPEGDAADLRVFDADNNRGIFPIAADVAAVSGYGTFVASAYTVTEGANLYDGVVGGRQYLRADGDQILVVKPSVLTAAFQAKVGDNYLIAPGARAEDIFRVARVFSPTWMENDAENDAYLLVRNGYATTGNRNPNVHPFFDVSKNENVLLNEMPIAGTLMKYKSAVAIKGLSA